MTTIEVKDLATAPLIEMVRDEGGRVDTIASPPGAPAIELVRIDEVHYVPSVLGVGQSLQIARGRYLPIEAVFDDWIAEFVSSRVLEKGVATFGDFADSGHAGDVCVLGNVFSRNFTHWHEELMKVVVLEQAGIDCAYVVSGLPKFARALLELIGIPAGRILEITAPTRFRNALYTTPVSYRNVADHPAVLLALRDRMLQVDVSGQPVHGERLWLDRGEQTRLGRKLVNVDEVHRLLERYGFQRLDMGALPVEGQIAVARGMRVLAGLHGSQFVHSQLMAPRSTVIECFSPLWLNPTYTNIYRVLRHRYSQLTSTNMLPLFPDPYAGDVFVDCHQLDLALQLATDA
jgi:hypothetical protein